MIRTLLVVEVAFYREGLAELLNKSGQVRVVATANDAESAERVARAELPDVVLVDVSIAESAEVVERLRTLSSPPKFVALAVNETPEVVLKWVEHGVAAYVPRDATLEHLLSVLNGVAHDELYCSPRMTALIAQRLAALAPGARYGTDRVSELSPREHEVLSLLARGLANKEIAIRLEISQATAKNHVHNILEKLRLHRRSEIASLLLRESQRRSA